MFLFGETCPLRISAKQSSQALHAGYLFYCSHFSESLCHMLRALKLCICDIYFTVPISQTAYAICSELSSFAFVISILLFPFLRQPMPYAQSSPALHLWYLFYCSHFSDCLGHMLRALQLCICGIYFTVPISQTA